MRNVFRLIFLKDFFLGIFSPFFTLKIKIVFMFYVILADSISV